MLKKKETETFRCSLKLQHKHYHLRNISLQQVNKQIVRVVCNCLEKVNDTASNKVKQTSSILCENWYEKKERIQHERFSDLIAISMTCMDNIRYANFFFVASSTSCLSHLRKTIDKLRESQRKRVTCENLVYKNISIIPAIVLTLLVQMIFLLKSNQPEML